MANQWTQWDRTYLKYKNNIKKFYKDKRHWLCEIYNDNLPTDAPPQARITF